jgi:undecaprenyl diphosphate synthase
VNCAAATSHLAGYSEWFFPPVYWPDFDKEQLRLALEEYGHRERRYGRVSPIKDSATA